MKNVFRLGAAVAAFAVMATGTTAYAADNADATATVEVLKPLTLAKAADLNFGQALVNGAGTITIAANGGLTCTSAGVICSGAVTAASFDISGGTAGKAVTITMPTSANDLIRLGAPAATTAASDRIGLSLTTPAAEVTLNAAGERSFGVGGTITFDGSETPGVYESTFNVSVEYS